MTTTNISLSRLVPFEDHPYQVRNDEEMQALTDSNLHREHLLPSEKAFAYKLKSEAMKHQGKKKESPENLWDASLIDPSMGQNVPKPDENRTTAEIGAQRKNGRRCCL